MDATQENYSSQKKSYASQGETGVHDAHYDLVSVLYHTLQSAETLEKYAQDAKQLGDSELSDFFRECQQVDRERAQRLKQFVIRRFQ